MLKLRSARDFLLKPKEFGEKSMVYYTDETPVVNKRAVAGYYLFLVLIGFAILLGPTGSGIPITLWGDRTREAHELATPDMGDFTDPESCIGATCHTDEFDYWNATGHATHVTSNSTYVFIGTHAERAWADFNATCAQCHATNWDNATDSHDGLGIQCGSCHDLTSPYYSVDGDDCASCHVGHGDGVVDDWSNSAHANSLTDLRTSSHAGSSCMHCMSTEGFIDQATDFDPTGDFNPLTCPACHSSHSNYSSNPGQIRAVNATELCAICHVGSHHPSATVWRGGPHDLADVECIDCHGWQPGGYGSAYINHTFAVDPEVACAQSTACHEGHEDWAINQLEEIQSAFHDLVEELETEATAFEAIVEAYNATVGANYTLTSYVLDEVETAVGVAHYYGYDRSDGFHDPMETFEAVNGAFRDLLDAKAFYYENLPAPAAGFSADTLIIVGGAAGGIVVGLLLGVLVGRRR